MMSDCAANPVVHVTCSWKAPLQIPLRDLVTVTHRDQYLRNEDGLTAMVNPESCVCLHKHEEEENGNTVTNDEPCFISLKIESEHVSSLSELVVVSEAKMIEVYGACQEYLTTVTAEFLCEVDEMSVYCAEIKLGASTQECSLKFARTSKPSEIWLYGIRVIWEHCFTNDSAMEHSSPSFNFMTVDERLKNCHAPISQRAERCKDFIQMYGSLSRSQKLPSDSWNVMPLLAMACKQNIFPHTSQSSVIGSLVDGSKGLEDGKRKQVEKESFQNATSENHKRFSKLIDPSSSKNEFQEHDCTKCTQSFRTVLDESLKSLENRLLRALDEKLAKLQQLQGRQIEHVVGQIIQNISSPEKGSSALSSQIHYKSYQFHNDGAYSYAMFNAPEMAKDRTIENAEPGSEESRELRTDYSYADDESDAVRYPMKPPELESFRKNSCTEHVNEIKCTTDNNSNDLLNPASVCLDKNEQDVLPLKVPLLDGKGKISMLCSLVSNRSKLVGGTVKDSDIEQIIMGLANGFQSSGMTRAVLSNDSNVSALLSEP